jgi:hypothetical protein
LHGGEVLPELEDGAIGRAHDEGGVCAWLVLM